MPRRRRRRDRPEGASAISSQGERNEYDTLVRATGSSPSIPPFPRTDKQGFFVYRTIEDLEAVQAWAASLWF